MLEVKGGNRQARAVGYTLHAVGLAVKSNLCSDLESGRALVTKNSRGRFELGQKAPGLQVCRVCTLRNQSPEFMALKKEVDRDLRPDREEVPADVIT